jgi:hypothetical protein
MQPTKFGIAINLKAAETLGLVLFHGLCSRRADEVIQ